MRNTMGTMGFATAALVIGSGACRADDWPQFLGPTRDGVVKEAIALANIPAAGLATVWRHEAGAGFAAPVVSGGKLILFHQVADSEVAECLDSESGQSLWKAGYKSDYRGGYGTGPGPRATPAVVAGRIYTLGGEGMLQCLNLADGAVVWQRPLNKDFQIPESFFGVASSPLVDDGRVYVNVGAPPDAGFVAFNAVDGATIWKSTHETASYSAPVLAKLDDGTKVVLFFARSGLHAVDPTTGKQHWFFRWRARGNASVNAATPIVSNAQAFITSSYDTGATLLNLGARSAEPVWKSDDAISCHYNTPVLHEGHIYGIDGRQEGGAKLRCVEWATGKVAWTKEGYGCASCLRIGNRLLILAERGKLELVQATPAAFKSLGSATIMQGLCRPAPALANGRLYARDESELVCIDLQGKTH